MTRRRFLSGLAAAAATATATTGCTSRGPGSRSRTLRVLTYNLHHGEGEDGRLDLERIAAVIRGAQPDLVALQEIDRKATRTGGVDQAAEYIRLTGLHGWYGAAMPFQGGEYGQALLSRWPLDNPRVLRLPGTPGREPRIAVVSEVAPPGIGRLRWAGVHLDASRDDVDRWAQAGALLEHFAGDATPRLLAGDFNATPDSRVIRRLLDPSTGWTDTAGDSAAPTSPAGQPRSRIDYVLASPGNRWHAVESRVLPEPVASDHRPLLAVVRWA